ncbi:MAG: hypothetical protein L6R45_19595 [Anaerolineae bacterium]|nr:hypothetical protein [Anaerolineae bacterium]
MSRKSDKSSHLLVEGKNDQHVIWALCEMYQLPETFDVIVPVGDNEGENSGGIETLLADIPVRLKESGLKTLGMVVDADEDIQACWRSIRSRLQKAQYDIPVQPSQEGFILSLPNRPRIGVWVMPDNQLPGRLEDFVGHLIPPKDGLKPIAEKTLQSIEKKQLNLFRPIHRSKALIHTWLAWQETPGMPMGQAITARVLLHDQTLANSFVSWLRRLFVE